jgi:hypothetical protein
MQALAEATATALDLRATSSSVNLKANSASPTFTGVASFPDGSAAAPSITNTGDTNTGLLFPAEDTVAISLGGTERFRINSAGLISGSGTSLGAWTSWTPTISGTGWALGNGSILARYRRIGSDVAFQIYVVWGSTSTYGSSGNTANGLRLNLPPVTAAGLVHLQTGYAADVSLGVSYTLVGAADTSSVYIVYALAGSSGNLSAVYSTVPFSWASGDYIYIEGTYEGTTA